MYFVCTRNDFTQTIVTCRSTIDEAITAAKKLAVETDNTYFIMHEEGVVVPRKTADFLQNF